MRRRGGDSRSRPLWTVLLLASMTAACSSAPPGRADDPDRQAFVASCSLCHALPHPKRHTWPQWQTLVHAMDARRRERGMPPLDPAQRDALLAYLEHYAR